MAVKRIYLDLDDVLVDFRTAACELLNADPVETYRLCCEKSVWDIPTALGISSSMLCSKINVKGTSFWSELKKHSYADELISLIAKANRLFRSGASEDASKQNDVYVLTNPGIDPDLYATIGKLTWMKSYFGARYTNGIVLKDKWHLAGPGRVLIDDHPENCEEWQKHGGTAILFPGPAGNREHVGREVEFVRNKLFELMLGK